MESRAPSTRSASRDAGSARSLSSSAQKEGRAVLRQVLDRSTIGKDEQDRFQVSGFKCRIWKMDARDFKIDFEGKFRRETNDASKGKQGKNYEEYSTEVH